MFFVICYIDDLFLYIIININNTIINKAINNHIINDYMIIIILF